MVEEVFTIFLLLFNQAYGVTIHSNRLTEAIRINGDSIWFCQGIRNLEFWRFPFVPQSVTLRCSIGSDCRAPDKMRILISIMPISSQNPVFYHLLQWSHRYISNKWSNIGCDEEILQLVSIVGFKHCIWTLGSRKIVERLSVPDTLLWSNKK